MKTAIITDSNSGITQATAKELGISVVPMPVLIDGEQYYEDLTLTQESFRQTQTFPLPSPTPLTWAKYGLKR